MNPKLVKINVQQENEHSVMFKTQPRSIQVLPGELGRHHRRNYPPDEFERFHPAEETKYLRKQS